MGSYEEQMKAKTTSLERLGDAFTTSNERLDYLVKLIEGSNIAGLKQSIDSLASMGGPIMSTPTETTQIRFQETLAALTGDRFFYSCPWDATNTSIAMHFPSGCNALVDVAVGHSDKQIYPRTNFIALNDASPVFIVSELIADNEPIWVEIRNADGLNPHTISVILTLQRRIR